jgi:hypothetical protein
MNRRPKISNGHFIYGQILVHLPKRISRIETEITMMYNIHTESGSYCLKTSELVHLDTAWKIFQTV